MRDEQKATELAQLRAEAAEMVAAIQPGDWQWGVGPHEDDGSPIEWFTKLLDGDVECRDIWTVWVEVDDDKPGVLVPAITGNGPRSEAHARLFAATPVLIDRFLKATEPRPLRVEVYETSRVDAGPDGSLRVTKFWWRARHESNGEIVAQGEGYRDRRDRDHIVGVLFPDIEPVEVDA